MKTVIIFLAACALLAMMSCGNPLASDDTSIVSITPASGSRIIGPIGSQLVGPIKITFDNNPTNVSLTSPQVIAWHLAGNELIITDLACDYGSKVEIYVKWATGAQYISYVCRRPPPPPPPPVHRHGRPLSPPIHPAARQSRQMLLFP